MLFLKRAGAGALGIGLLMAALAPRATGAGTSVRLDLYVMSLCPFGVRAENEILPAVKALGGLVELRLHFIGNESSEKGQPRFTSLHGSDEVEENIRQVCAMKHFPDKYADYIIERNKDVRSPDWESPARTAGLNTAALSKCATGPEGAELYAANLTIFRARQANMSPTIDIDDVPRTWRGEGQTAMVRALCEALAKKGAKPKACANLPEDPPVAASASRGTGLPARTGPPLGTGKTVSLDFYVMSLCPFGVQAENDFLPVVKSLGGLVDLRLHFIGSESSEKGQPRFTSSHGVPEVEENIRQVCAMKLFPDQYGDYIFERNKDVHSPGWESPARAAGLNLEALSRCAKGPEGAALYSANLAAFRMRQTFSSPTIDIDGVPHLTGGRSRTAITRALCRAIAKRGSNPEACANLPPEPPPVEGAGNCDAAPSAAAAPAEPISITAVVEQSCAMCGPTFLELMEKRHPGAAATVLDYQSPEGRAVVAEHRPKTLPLYVLDKKVERDANFKTLLATAYARSKSAYVVVPGSATYLPSVQLSRPRVPRHLDLFTTSQAPAYAQPGLDLVKFFQENRERLKDLTLSLHFIVRDGDTRAAPGLTSERGEGEIEENVRQICLFQHASVGIYFAYLQCLGPNGPDRSRAARCLQPGERVARCIESGEGLQFLRQDAKLVRELGVAKGPAFLWENRYGPFGWNETDWRTLLRAGS